MSAFKDHFSAQSTAYARSRPTYPAELFAHLAVLCARRQLAWDCATGNGQAAIALAEHFERVVATDASRAQIDNAFPQERVTYAVAPAEEPGLDPGCTDLVTVAQALHWFDPDRFYDAVRRVLAPRGVIAVWSYAGALVNDAVDPILKWFHHDLLEAYWPPERRFVEEGYRTLPFPFDPVEVPAFDMTARWTLADLLAYLGTWSSVKAYREREGREPLDLIHDNITAAWNDPTIERVVRWPLSMRVGRHR